MREIPNINTWALKQKELLEKLSLEISRDFSISEKLAKKFIYETHLNLDELKSEILNFWEENNKEKQEKFDDKKLEKLLFALKWAKEFIEKASKKEIEDLKNLLEKNEINIWEFDSEVLEKIFSKKMLEKAQNPQNVAQQIMGWSLWILNSWILITDIFYNLWKWIITSIPDLIALLKWEAEIESFKKL